MSSYTMSANGIIVLLYKQTGKHGIFGVVRVVKQLPDFLLFCFFTTNRI